jgi:hypothetical protein
VGHFGIGFARQLHSFLFPSNYRIFSRRLGAGLFTKSLSIAGVTEVDRTELGRTSRLQQSGHR